MIEVTEKEYYENLKDFVSFLNSKMDSYVSSHMVQKVIKTIRIRSVVYVKFSDEPQGDWIFENEEVAKEIHSKLKAVLLMKESVLFKHNIESSSHKEKTKTT